MRRLRTILVRVRAGLLDLGRELRQPAGLALLVVTLVLATRWALSEQTGAVLLRPLWVALGGISPLFREGLIQHQVISIVLQLAVPALVVWLVHRRRLRDFGLGLGEPRFWLPIAGGVLAIQLPVVAFYLARDPVYIRRYPSLTAARRGGAVFWIWESSRALYMLSWEFLFRGYLLFALEPRQGSLACVTQMIPFVLMHIVSNKPISEVYFTVASGLLSGLFALLSRSAWPVILLHGVGAVLLDVFVVYR